LGLGGSSDLTGSSATAEPVYGDKVAIVIELHIVPNLIALMLHFSNVLGPEWTVVLFTLEKDFVMPQSSPFQRELARGQIQIAFLPPDTDFSTHQSVSVFLTQPWLWEQLQTSQRVLMFQTDSIICARANRTIDEFIEYDFVGAPIAEGRGFGYNGGLSLRNPKIFLEITADPLSDFVVDSQKGIVELRYEDQWFFQKLQALKHANLPSEDVAKEFAVETVWFDTPIGYHQPTYWHSGKNLHTITEYCPEIGMLQGKRFDS
jgi:hypothetical protein